MAGWTSLVNLKRVISIKNESMEVLLWWIQKSIECTYMEPMSLDSLLDTITCNEDIKNGVLCHQRRGLKKLIFSDSGNIK